MNQCSKCHTEISREVRSKVIFWGSRECENCGKKLKVPKSQFLISLLFTGIILILPIFIFKEGFEEFLDNSFGVYSPVFGIAFVFILHNLFMFLFAKVE